LEEVLIVAAPISTSAAAGQMPGRSLFDGPFVSILSRRRLQNIIGNLRLAVQTE
jgi:hypothetical protein